VNILPGRCVVHGAAISRKIDPSGAAILDRRIKNFDGVAGGIQLQDIPSQSASPIKTKPSLLITIPEGLQKYPLPNVPA
jgi:hypothetical protein